MSPSRVKVRPVDLLSRAAGIIMLGVFAINVYIGLFDTTLFKLNQLHYYLNWGIAIVDLAAALILIVFYRSRILVLLAGVGWPAIYILSLALDVETTLCAGTNLNCWPSVSDAYRYLILGSKAEGWVLWPYTISTAIAVLVIIAVLSSVSFAFLARASKQNVQARVNQGASERTES